MAERYQGRTSRADEQRAPARPAQGESDPLAELARLIGQTDPFAAGAREQPAPPSTTPDLFEAEEEPAPPSWMQRMARHQAAQAAPVAAPAAPRSLRANVQPVAPQQHAPSSYHQDYAYDRSYKDDWQESPQDAQAYDQAQAHYDETAYAQAQPLELSPYPGYEQQQQPDYDDGYAAEDESEQDLAQRQPRRGGMVTVAAVVALAFVGTAGAYAYRSYTSAPRTAGDAPIIKADPGPTKIVPATSADASGKQIQDRLSQGPSGEKMVSREEQPVDVNSARSGPRVVFPPPGQMQPGTASVGTTPRPPAAQPNGTLNGDEPKRVRTLSIRPDQPDPAATPKTVTPAPRSAAPAPTQTATAAAGNAPISLSPQASTRSASASASAPAGNGAYMVQIASQRSETEAMASFKAMQAKYPNILGSRQAVIRRADLGDKGVYYRAMVGPFASVDEATMFCGGLKSSGGQCVVPRN